MGGEEVPLGRQAEAEDQANEWGRHWGEEGGEVQQVDWPQAWEKMEDGAVTPLTVEKMDRAAVTFPTRTGLGWDGIHPRAVVRLPHSLRAMLVRIMAEAERVGRWPRASHEVVVNMLAKPTGGFRPINLFGMIQRLWTRIRREDARIWEKRHDRTYMYAGVGRAANNAAWMMAIRAEMARMDKVEYIQVQLDLVKAFEYVPHAELCSGAAQLGYPRALLRLSVAAYTAPRRVTAASAMSREVGPRRGDWGGVGVGHL